MTGPIDADLFVCVPTQELPRVAEFRWDLAAPPALAAPHEQRSAARVEVGLGERERLADRRPARQSTTIRPRRRRPWTPSPACRITVTISSIVGGSAG